MELISESVPTYPTIPVTSNTPTRLGEILATCVKPADAQKAGKVPVWQGVFSYFSNALQAVGAISKFGCIKHNKGKMPTKWRDYPVDVYADALARHVIEEGKGHLYDSESQMLHAGHEAWNALARLEKLLETHPLVSEVWTNDRDSNSQGSSGPVEVKRKPSVRIDEETTTFGRLA